MRKLTQNLRSKLSGFRIPKPVCLVCSQPIHVRHQGNGWMHRACEPKAQTGQEVDSGLAEVANG